MIDKLSDKERDILSNKDIPILEAATTLKLKLNKAKF